mgnify:CR=1 FL=1
MGLSSEEAFGIVIGFSTVVEGAEEEFDIVIGGSTLVEGPEGAFTIGFGGSTFVEGTKKFIDMWGADAVRDCDGVTLPDNVEQLNCDVYKAYFIVREDLTENIQKIETEDKDCQTTFRYQEFDINNFG